MPKFHRLLLSALLAALSPGSARAADLAAPNGAAAMRAFVNAYWDPRVKYFYAYSDRKTHPEHGSGPVGGLYSDFWWEAQLWDLVMDAAETTGDARDRAMIADVYDGFAAQYPDWQNDYNDDLGWWAQAALRAHAITGDPRYLKRAQTLADGIWASWDDTYGGGLWWRRSVHDQKNVATNAPYVYTCVGLYTATRDRKYLDRARQVFAWVRNSLTEGPRVFDHREKEGTLVRWDFTYNFGTYARAALSLYRATGERAYLDAATGASDWALANLRAGPALLDEGDGDGGGFRGVFVRTLAELAREPGLDRYSAALQASGLSAWNARNTAGLTGGNWNTPTPDGTVLQSLTAASATAAMLRAGGSAGRPVADTYEAENTRRTDVGAGGPAAGFSGRGYVNDFHRVGSSVGFDLNVPRAGRYQLSWRYSAGGGAAGRTLNLNGVDQRLAFGPTPDWQTWAELKGSVDLQAGYNRLDLSVGPQDQGWLNLDVLSVEAQP